MTRIAVVDAAQELRDDMSQHLRQAGHEVQAVPNGQGLRELLPRFAPRIVVLDAHPCDKDGLRMASQLRQHQPDIGIVMLTHHHALADRLAGYRQGADHSLTKPVQVDELVLVVRNLERRIGADAPKAWRLSQAALSLSAPDGRAVAVTASEAALLQALAQAPQRQCSRQELVLALGADWLSYDQRRLEAIISRLRRKLTQRLGTTDVPLRALRGQGYGFVEPLTLR